MSQKSRIIVLKWKQFKMNMMRSNKQMKNKPMKFKRLSGRMQFKMIKKDIGYSNDQIMNKWKRLPFEAKNMW